MKSEAKRYGNCKVYSPEGELMFLCNRSRIDWYLKRNLAVVLKTKPQLEAKLTFQPNGKGYAYQDKYFFIPRKDRCVCCGEEDFSLLTRHHIIPTCYRRWLPDEYKTHKSYDVVKVCRDCHDSYEISAQELKQQIADELNVEIFGRVSKLSSIKGYANTLLSHMEKLPEDVFDKMYSDVSEYLGKDYIGEGDLEKISTMKYCEDPNYKTWGLECIEKINDIESFIIMWRKHFIDTAKPKYMPEGWSIYKNIRKPSYGEFSN